MVGAQSGSQSTSPAFCVSAGDVPVSPHSFNNQYLSLMPLADAAGGSDRRVGKQDAHVDEEGGGVDEYPVRVRPGPPPLRLGSRSTNTRPPAMHATGHGAVSVFVVGAGLMDTIVRITGLIMSRSSPGITHFLDIAVERKMA